ncbi:glycosyltransferase, group 2 family protein [Bifidobacterium tsurumiense]|uniref:Glycosyltransferase, group 2 family protein n=2 Tax=Bifidobacterium tsurumiense TaxID=356829 RepID=A0A087EI25_9BIFI|nr:glycosyltransferase, group 2 family protein [Bifidobacterium tsurumiense]
MPAKINLFVSCHKLDTHIPDNDLLVPVQVGSALTTTHSSAFQRDDQGKNISDQNRSYCELTAQYWAYMNVDADYYGFLHYRRYFNFSEKTLPTHQEPFIFGDVVFDDNSDRILEEIAFNEALMRRIIESNDFIAPEPIEALEKTTVYEQYKHAAGHHIEDFDTVLSLIRTRYPEIWPSAQKYVNQTKVYACNMFVMKRDIFKKYSAFLFDILDRHEHLRDITHYAPIDRRVSGYLGERICGIYLTYLYDQGYRGKDLQRVYFRNTAEVEPAAINVQNNGKKTDPKTAGITLKPVTRGSGKIYGRLNISGTQPSSISVTSKNASGHSIPAKVVGTKLGKVVVLPIIGQDQVLTVSAVDNRTNKQLVTELPVTDNGARLKSYANTLRKNPITNEIRNCDDEMLPDDTKIVIESLIDNGDGTDIIHGHALFMVSTPSNNSEYIDIFAINNDGVKIDVRQWICLGDETMESTDIPGTLVRRVAFSLQVPQLNAFTVWAQFPDSPRQDGFFNVNPIIANQLRTQWSQLVQPASADPGYDQWFRTQHRTSWGELTLQRKASFNIRPKFSIIVPLYKTPIAFFRDMANSVRKQTYSNWELLLVDASPEDQQLSQQIDSLCKADHRVRRISIARNEGITLNTNAGIKAAKGDFVCFLDHDDFLEPDALFRYACAINNHAETDMLYCDEDKFDNGKYREPFFKTEWNPDLLLGMNYVCHFLTVRKSVLDTLELPGKEYDGSQDWHMTFRIGELARYVHHEPHVLYHWRVHSQSTAQNANQKNYTLDSSRLSIESHLERTGVEATVKESTIAPRRFAIDYEIKENPLVSIIIPNKDALPVLHQCLTSIREKTTYSNYEVIIVENNSEDEFTFDYYEDAMKIDPHIKVATLQGQGMESFNFSRIINFGAAQANGEYLLLLNNDTKVITPEWIEELLGPHMRKDVGITGAKLLFPDNTIQHAGVGFGPDGPGHLRYSTPRYSTANFEFSLVARDMGAVTGACMMIHRGTFDSIGGMEEELAVNYNDIDLCLKVIRQGLRVVYCPTAELYHFESVSRGSELIRPANDRFMKEKGEFQKRWPSAFSQYAPFENPNLEFGNIYQKIRSTPWHGIWA